MIQGIPTFILTLDNVLFSHSKASNVKNIKKWNTADHFSQGVKLWEQICMLTELWILESKTLSFCLDNKFMVTLGLYVNPIIVCLFKLFVLISFKNYIIIPISSIHQLAQIKYVFYLVLLFIHLINNLNVCPLCISHIRGTVSTTVNQTDKTLAPMELKC